MAISKITVPGEVIVDCTPGDERHVFFNRIDGYATIFLTKDQVCQNSTILGFMDCLEEFVKKYGDNKIKEVKLRLESGELTIVFDRS